MSDWSLVSVREPTKPAWELVAPCEPSAALAEKRDAYERDGWAFCDPAPGLGGGLVWRAERRAVNALGFAVMERQEGHSLENLLGLLDRWTAEQTSRAPRAEVVEKLSDVIPA